VSSTDSSRALFERALRVLPAGVSYAIRDIAPYPFYVARASGCRLTDVDGNLYTDYWSGHGALVLGHAPSSVVAAVSRQIEKGSHYGFSHALEVELAELVTAMVPGAELVRYTNSGTEANMYAVGLARAYTGRTRIAKMEGGWHGGYDPLRKAVHAPFDELEAGIDPAAVANTVVLPFNDLEAASAAIREGTLACVVVEPVLGAAGIIPSDCGYLAGLKALCDRHGTLLIFDEVITGFRLARGGAQELYGVTPDITILGKIVGGGFPVGALCGRREVLERLDHRRFPDRRAQAFHGGTFAANPVTMAAGIATLMALEDGSIHRRLDRLGELARTGIARIFESSGLDVAVTGIGSIFGIHFRRGAPRNAREASEADASLARGYHQAMLARGIAYLTPAVPHLFLNAAHTEEDLADFLAATEAFSHGVQGMACGYSRPASAGR